MSSNRSSCDSDASGATGNAFCIDWNTISTDIHSSYNVSNASCKLVNRLLPGSLLLDDAAARDSSRAEDCDPGVAVSPSDVPAEATADRILTLEDVDARRVPSEYRVYLRGFALSFGGRLPPGVCCWFERDIGLLN